MAVFACCDEQALNTDDAVALPDTQPAVVNDDDKKLEVVDEVQKEEAAKEEAAQEPEVKEEAEPAVKEEAEPVVEAVAEAVAEVAVAEAVVEAVAEPAAPPLPEKFTMEIQLKQGMLGAKFDGVTAVDIAAGSKAAAAGIKKGYKVAVYDGESVPEGKDAKELSQWLLQKLQGPRPAVVQFEPPILKAIFIEGTLGVKFKGVNVVEVTPGQQADTAGVKVGDTLLSFGTERVPAGKKESELLEWLGQRLQEPRPVDAVFDHPTA